MCPLPKKSSVKSVLLYAVMFAAMLMLDIMTKFLVASKLEIGRTVPIIEDVIHFTYVRNTGAAFGIMSDNTVMLTVLSVIILTALAGAVIYVKPKDDQIRLAVCMIAAGAIGNMIDRIRFGYVVDFIDVRLINFAVFNLADCFVCIGAFMIVLYILFHKEA